MRLNSLATRAGSGRSRRRGIGTGVEKLFIGRGQDKTFSTLEVILRVIEGTYPFKNDGEIEFLNLYEVKEDNK